MTCPSEDTPEYEEPIPDPADPLAGLLRFLLNLGEPWMERAECRGTAPTDGSGDRPNPFFPGRGQSTRLAYKMCQQCPVTQECREYQVRTGSVGIWAGKYTEHAVSAPTPIQDGRPRQVARSGRNKRASVPVSNPQRIAARKQTG